MVSRIPHRRDADGLTATLSPSTCSRSPAPTCAPRRGTSAARGSKALLDGATGALRLTPVLDASPALHAALVADGWEGTVAKRTSGRYRCGHRSQSWVKLKSPAARDRDRRRVLAA